MRSARSRDGRMGPKAVATASEAARRAWVDERLVDFGRTRAQSVGWTDIYTFTKAMAERVAEDRKSTRLNSSHVAISYAVFCLKKKSTSTNTRRMTTSVIDPSSRPRKKRRAS